MLVGGPADELLGEDDLAASSALGGNPAVAERAEAKPVDDPPELGPGDSVDAVFAAEDGVLQTESRDAESFAE